MISQVLWSIQHGWVSLKKHTKFAFIIAVMFIFPLLVLLTVQNTAETSIENLKTVQKQTIAVLHTSVQNSSSDTWPLLVSQLGDGVSLQSYSVSEGVLKLTDSVGPEFEISSVYEAATPSSGEVFIFEKNNPGRVWTAITKTGDGSQERMIVSVHDFERIDSVVLSRLNGLYVLMIFGLLFFGLVAYWLMKQVNWARRYKKLEANLSEQAVLVDTITHEFRAPLTAIKGYLSFLSESNRLRPKDIDALENISLSSDRMLHLVNDFLEVAKMQAGKLELHTESVKVSEVVYRVISELGATAAEKKLVLRDATQDSSMQLTTDPERFTQILTNLVSNAVKYTPKGSVVITYEKNPLFVILRVQDTGSGMSAEDQDKLFKPFSRVGGVEKSNIVGSGLGMWITQKLALLLGGKITVESIEGVGTHVVLKFDLRKIAAQAREGIL